MYLRRSAFVMGLFMKLCSSCGVRPIPSILARIAGRDEWALNYQFKC